MRVDLLHHIRCPAVDPNGETHCLGDLALADAPRPRTTTDGSDIVEGFLRCTSCEASYPIMAGVLILIPRPYHYVRSAFPFMKGLLADLGNMSKDFNVRLHQAMLADLQTKEEKLFPRPMPYNEKTSLPMHKWIGTYVLTHYLEPMPSENDAIDTLLRQAHDRGPLSLLADMGRRYLSNRPSLAIDLGCSVGGLTARFTDLAEFVVGVDLSFEKVLTARRIVLGVPKKADPLRLYREGSSYDSIPLPAVKADNIEFIVGSGTEIPFGTDSAGLVSSCNLLDVISDPIRFLDEKRRTLKKGGLLLVATPYLDNTPAVLQHLEAGTGAPQKTVREQLSDFEIVEEHDRVPWLLRASDRHYDLYLDHCFAAIRRNAD